MEKEYLIDDGSGYGSHIPPLICVCKHIKIVNALELGMGIYSTGFLIDHAIRLTSLEMQEQAWFDNMLEKFGSNLDWKASINFNELSFKEFNPRDYDFVFVDGVASTRAISVNYFMEGGTDTVMAHDTESTWYGWHHVKKAKGYYEHKFTKIAPYTTVWTRNDILIKALLNEEG